MALARTFLGQFGLDLLHPRLDQVQAGFQAAAMFRRPLAVDLPRLQPEDVPQDLFAARGRLLGELVGLALQEEGNVDEGVVIEPQDLLDARLRLAVGMLGERPP